MDPNSLLEQLKDIHSPNSIGMWPPAIGWIALVLISFIALIAIVWFVRHWYKSNAWRRAALKEFKHLEHAYSQNQTIQTLSDISCLMKRCAASVNHDTRMLAVTGEQWESILNTNKSPLNDQEIQLLAYNHYQAQCEQLNNSALSNIKKWIKTLKPLQMSSSLNIYPQPGSPATENPSEPRATLALSNIDDKIENKSS